MREIIEAVVVILALTFIVLIGFMVLGMLFGFIDWAQTIASTYISPDPTFTQWYNILRENLPLIASGTLLASLIAVFIYVIVSGQRRRYYEAVAPAIVAMIAASSFAPLALSASSGFVIPWHLQGWGYRAIFNVTGISGWVILSLDGEDSFFLHARSDLADVRVLDKSGNTLAFYVAEYEPSQAICKIAVYVPSPDTDLVLVYWGVSQSSAVEPSYIFMPRTYMNEYAAMLVYEGYNSSTIYVLNMSWSELYSKTSNIYVLDPESKELVPSNIIERNQTIVKVGVDAPPPLIVVFANNTESSPLLPAAPTVINISSTSSADQVNGSIRISLDSSWCGWSFVGNGSDIYFTLMNGTPIYYYVEALDKVGQEASIWLKIPYLASGNNTIIYMYYGGVNKYPEYHDPGNTFLFFDDFNGASLDSSKWSIVTQEAGAGYTVADSILSLTSTSSGADIVIESVQSFDKTVWVEARVRMDAACDWGVRSDVAGGVTIQYSESSDGSVTLEVTVCDSSGCSVSSLSSGPDQANYHTDLLKLIAEGTYHVYYYRDGSFLKASGTNPGDSLHIKLHAVYAYSNAELDVDWVRAYKPLAASTSLTCFMIHSLGFTGTGLPLLVESYHSGMPVRVWPLEKPGIEIGGASNVSFTNIVEGFPEWARTVMAYALPLLPLTLVPAGYAGAGAVASAMLAWLVYTVMPDTVPWALPVIETMAAVGLLGLAVAQKKE